MQAQFAILKKILKTECGRDSLFFYPNPGNWGDGLIRYGTLKFFNDINLNYKELTKSDRKKLTKSYRNFHFPLFRKHTVIYGGGGGWCKLWNHSVDIVTKFKKKFNVIVMPSTYEISYSIPNTLFFCRDMLESKQNMPNANFCHDMAFYIGKEFSKISKGRGKGYFFRCDVESSNRINIPSCNNDISLRGSHLSEVSQFFDEINRFKKIYTDRLHVSIAACLLEKEVHLYPGSYFKNRAVYISSMKDYFQNVCFHGEFDI